jgi:SpoVK/Ycf46/Vps4 family AAA+-type ATPase
LPVSDGLPAWAAALRERYVAGVSSVFVLHGNVHDLVPWEGRFLPLREFLAAMLSRTKDTVLFYDVAAGLRFAEPTMEARFRLAVDARRTLDGAARFPADVPRDPYRLFPYFETFLRDASQHGALIIEYADTVCPDGTVSFMGEQDRAIRVTLQRWAADPQIHRSDNLVLLVADNLADLDRDVRSAPRVTPVEIPLPSDVERQAFIAHALEAGDLGMPVERIAALTSGLSNFQIEGLFREARAQGGLLDDAKIAARKRAMIEKECWGLVEIIESKHDFSVVGGMEGHKTALRRVVQAIDRGQKERVPMGILLVGPMGTGKSFLMEAFANECGLTVLKLKNFRDRWVGSTEGNLEKVLGVVQALGNTLVVIDEGDRSIGGHGQGDGDGGVDARVIARLKEFMSDTSHRGSIVFAMMTNRPDKLDADMKRPGRFDLKLPFFPPQTADERTAIGKALAKKNKLAASRLDWAALAGRTDGMTGAEIEAVLIRAADFCEERGATELSDADVAAAADDFLPSRDDAMMRYMELLAVFECSSRRMLPGRYRALDSGALNAELRDQQRRLLRP